MINNNRFQVQYTLWEDGYEARAIGYGLDYFDPDFTDKRPQVEPGTTIPGYLVITGPTAPIGDWELRLLFIGDAFPQGWAFSGVASGDLGPTDFRVALDSPLPVAANVLLATADFMVPTNNQTTVYGLPVNPSEIPGYGSFLDGNQPGNHLPLGETSSNWLAAINYRPVAVDAPATPTAETTGGEVVLTWPCGIDPVDGYNVYRRLGQGASARLNAAPINCTGGQGEFRDQPQGEPGTVVAYTVTRLVDGEESSASVSAEITLQSNLPVRTSLLASYPNPFNPQTTVPFEMARTGHARLAVYDAAGKLVRVLADADFGAGRQERVWLGRDTAGQRVPSGVYYLRLETETDVSLGKILLLK